MPLLICLICYSNVAKTLQRFSGGEDLIERPFHDDLTKFQKQSLHIRRDCNLLYYQCLPLFSSIPLKIHRLYNAPDIQWPPTSCRATKRISSGVSFFHILCRNCRTTVKQRASVANLSIYANSEKQALGANSGFENPILWTTAPTFLCSHLHFSRHPWLTLQASNRRTSFVDTLNPANSPTVE